MRQEKTWARGRLWWERTKKPEGGFVLVREAALQRAWAALSASEIGLRDLRVWLASFEVVERRLAARSSMTPRFMNSEIHRLVGGIGGEHIRRSIRNLGRAGLGTWDMSKIELLGGRGSALKSSGRLVPIPRMILREMARSARRAYIATMLGHLQRCLFYRDGECVSGGYCKCAAIAEAYGVSLRAVKAARSKLAADGWIRLLVCDQLRLNRLGAPVVISLEKVCTTKTTPRTTISTSRNAPPNKHNELSLRRSENQKPGVAGSTAGVSVETRRGTRKPIWQDVQQFDLDRPERLVALFHAAVRLGHIKNCEADKLTFLALAAHARRVGRSNPPGLFVSLVKNQRIQLISLSDEDQARTDLRRLRQCSASHYSVDRDGADVFGQL